jgi:hypothetical protein
MTTAHVLVSPQPKKDPKRAPAPPTRREDVPVEVTSPDPDDRWADMPCTD